MHDRFITNACSDVGCAARFRIRLIAVVLITLAVAANAQGPPVDRIDLGTLGGLTSAAEALNASGQVVGLSNTSSSETHAFSWTLADGMIDLGTLGGNYSFAEAVNDNGQVVGFSRIDASHTHAFLWTPDDGMIDLGTLGGLSSTATDVNAGGQIVGCSDVDSTLRHVFSWTMASGMIDLGTLDSVSCEYAVLNASGLIVGNLTGRHSVFAFGWTPEVGMFYLNPLGNAIVRGVNDSGWVAGLFFGHAVVWQVHATPSSEQTAVHRGKS